MVNTTSMTKVRVIFFTLLVSAMGPSSFHYHPYEPHLVCVPWLRYELEKLVLLSAKCLISWDAPQLFLIQVPPKAQVCVTWECYNKSVTA